MQLGIPVDVSAAMVAMQLSLGESIELCAKAAGLEGKQVEADLKLDKAQWSRWKSGDEGVRWPKLQAVMDRCGNDAPLLWMLHARGYDLNSLRKRESETEKLLRLAREENAALRRVLQGQSTAA